MNALRFFCCITIAPMLLLAYLPVLSPQSILEAQTRFGEDYEPKIPILKLKGNISITRLNQINSSYQEANLSITPDGKRMFFMSDRGAQVWSRRPDTLDRFDGDIWVSERVNGEWQAPRCLDATVNTARGEDEPNISADGQAVIFQSWQPGWQNSGGPYYSAQLQGSKWAKPVGVGGGINLFFTQMRKQTGDLYGTDGAAFSANGRLFVVACGTDYDGPMDLYFSRKAGKAGWLYCQKLDVSTDGNERSVHLAADGRTLYFASDGLGGFGGLDIFKATLNDDGTVTNITNIGEPFNTKADDYGFTVSADGSEVYFIRNGDIFMAKLTSAFAALKPEPVAVVSGTVRSKAGDEPLIAKITFRGASEMDSEEVSTSDTGYYSAVLRVGKTYQQSITAPGHKEMKRVVSIPASQKSSTLHADIVLLPQSK